MEVYAGSNLILLGALAIFVAVAIGALLLLWIAMPFSVFGLKGLLKKSIEEQEKTNRLLRSILEEELSRTAERGAKAEEKSENIH